VSGKRVTFVGDAMAAVVQGVEEVRILIGQPPVVVGGLAVMCRLASPYRATTDLDVVDRLLGPVPQLQVLRAAQGAEPVEPTSVLLPTVHGQVRVDVLEVRQIEIDQPSDDPGDRLHASAHAWASDSATGLTIEVVPLSGAHVEVSALVAEPGPLIAMKLQAIMNRAVTKQGTDLQLRQLNAADNINDLRIPPGNRLEKLVGNRAGQHSIRINEQYRICFVWTKQGPADVEITDYH
jgi:plasmid maintenance system killer protein